MVEITGTIADAIPSDKIYSTDNARDRRPDFTYLLSNQLVIGISANISVTMKNASASAIHPVDCDKAINSNT